MNRQMILHLFFFLCFSWNAHTKSISLEMERHYVEKHNKVATSRFDELRLRSPYYMKNLQNNLSKQQKEPTLSQKVSSNLYFELQNFMNNVYAIKVSIGEPQQEFTFIADTGSSDLWCLSIDAGLNIPDSRVFDPSLSSDFNLTDVGVTLAYGTGVANGSVAFDDVHLGELVAKNQGFVFVQDVDDFFHQSIENQTYDGILGLAFSEISQSGDPVVKTLFDQNQLDTYTYSFDLKDESEVSRMILGDPDESLAPNGFVYVDVSKTSDIPYAADIADPDTYSFWGIKLEDVKIGDKSISAGDVFDYDVAIMDTGTSAAFIPQMAFVGLINYLQNDVNLFCQLDEDFLVFVCADGFGFYPTNQLLIDAIGPMTFNIGGELFEMPTDEFCIFFDDDPDLQGTFIVLLQPFGDDPTWLLGDIFLRSHYMVFDMGEKDQNPRVGVAIQNKDDNKGNGGGDKSKSLSGTVIVIIVVAIVLVLILCITCIYCTKKKKSEGREQLLLEQGQYSKM